MGGSDPGMIVPIEHPSTLYGYQPGHQPASGFSYSPKGASGSQAPLISGDAAGMTPYYQGHPSYIQPQTTKDAPYYSGYPRATQPGNAATGPYPRGYPDHTQLVAVGTSDPGHIVMETPSNPTYAAPYLPTVPTTDPTGQYVQPYGPKPVAPAVPAGSAVPAVPAVPAASVAPAEKEALVGYCSVKIAFSVCSLVGRAETFHYLKQKYEAPGNLPVLDITAKKEDKSYFAAKAGCFCKTEYKIGASKNVTTKEDAEFYMNRLKPIFETFVTKDEKFVCIDYGDPAYSGQGCPAPQVSTAATPAVPVAPTNGVTATASATATATSNGGGPASATAVSTGGDATAIATATGSTKCRVVKVVKLCVTDKATFSSDVQAKEKEFAGMLGLKKKSFHRDLKYSEATPENGFCSQNLALTVEISIPVDSAQEGNGLLQATDALASLLIGQTLPSVVGGKNGAPAVAQCL